MNIDTASIKDELDTTEVPHDDVSKPSPPLPVRKMRRSRRNKLQEHQNWLEWNAIYVLFHLMKDEVPWMFIKLTNIPKKSWHPLWFSSFMQMHLKIWTNESPDSVKSSATKRSACLQALVQLVNNIARILLVKMISRSIWSDTVYRSP